MLYDCLLKHRIASIIQHDFSDILPLQLKHRL